MDFDPFWANDSKVMANATRGVAKRYSIRRPAITLRDFTREGVSASNTLESTIARSRFCPLSEPFRQPGDTVGPKVAHSLQESAKMTFVAGAMAFTLDKQSRRIRDFLTLLLVWTFVGAVSYVRYVIEARPSNAGNFEELLEWLTCFYPWVFLTPALFALERRFAILGSNWKTRLAFFASISLPASYLAYVSTILLDACVRLAFHRYPLITDAWWPMPLGEVVMEQAIFWPTVAACGILRRFVELRDKERLAGQLALEKTEIEASLRRSELELLRTRLDPHFLFNSLQNISTLARKDPDAASRMLARLGDVLRAALRKGAEGRTTLAAEIELTKAYVAVEEIRFAGRLAVLFEIDPGTESALVPGFLLQPLVENAMNHGLRGNHLGGAIWISSTRNGDTIRLTVRDNGSGLDTEDVAALEKGIGLGSTCERLERMYAGRHSLSIRKLPEGGTEVNIALPFETNLSVPESLSHDIASIAHRR